MESKPFPAKLVAGIRNNNPGNLMDNGIPWEGLVGRDSEGRCIFKTMAKGIRAAGLDLLNDYGKKRKRTPSTIITEYAPPNHVNSAGVNVGNNTEAYISFFAKEMNVGRDEDFGLRDGDSRVNITKLRLALNTIFRMECGHEQAALIDAREFDSGLMQAVARVPVIVA